MRRMCHGGSFALFLLIGCGSDGRSGPALERRPEVQTCLPDPSEGMPARLSDTGCFTDLKALEPGPDLIPYDVNSPLWTDGAFKPRYMVVPHAKQITIEEDGSWVFPEGSVLIKAFGFELEVGDPESRRVVETRFMVRRNGRWDYATYQWNDEGTEGELLPPDESKTIEYTIRTNGEPKVIEYLFPNRDACVTCHGAAINEVLGPKTAQVNRDRNYDGVVANQLVAMAEIDLLALDAAEEIEPDAEPRMVSPQNGEGALGDRARAYLDANCAHCHQPGGWAPSDIGLDFRYQVPLEETGVCDPMKYFEWVGMPRVAPGNPEGSGILQRFVLLDALRMPSLGTSTTDSFGAGLLTEWIARLDACP
jgi:uncharacterized repeat protein (TIGR03806 family)